jgi:precorrin-8X/cobalt-precorrin-8 methylmutase
MDYLRNPDATYARSFAIIRDEAPIDRLPEAVQPVAVRLIHACGMIDILDDLRVSPELPDIARTAIFAGRPVLADCEMVRSAIIRRYLPENGEVICTLNDPRAADAGREKSITRSAAAVDLWREHIDGSVVVIGNAPTALFALLEMIDAGAPKPAAIIAMPVGFVGAAESKAELYANPRGIPFATVLGRRGGSAMAAGAFNALFARHQQ